MLKEHSVVLGIHFNQQKNDFFEETVVLCVLMIRTPKGNCPKVIVYHDTR